MELVQLEILPILQVLSVWLLCQLVSLDYDQGMPAPGTGLSRHHGVQLLDTGSHGVTESGGVFQRVLSSRD